MYDSHDSPAGAGKVLNSGCLHTTGKSWSSVTTIPDTRRVKGSSSYSQTRQNFGIRGFGMATPQKRAKTMTMNGLRREEMKEEGVSAAIIWPAVTEKSSVISTTKNW